MLLGCHVWFFRQTMTRRYLGMESLVNQLERTLGELEADRDKCRTESLVLYTLCVYSIVCLLIDERNCGEPSYFQEDVRLLIRTVGRYVQSVLFRMHLRPTAQAKGRDRGNTRMMHTPFARIWWNKPMLNVDRTLIPSDTRTMLCARGLLRASAYSVELAQNVFALPKYCREEKGSSSFPHVLNKNRDKMYMQKASQAL